MIPWESASKNVVFLHGLWAVTRSLPTRSICRDTLPATMLKSAEPMIGLLKLKQFVLSRCQLQECKGGTIEM